MYLQTRVFEQYIVIGGVLLLLCFTPLFFLYYALTPFVVLIVCGLLAWLTFGISHHYIRLSSKIETLVLLSLLTLGSVLAMFHSFSIVQLPFEFYLYFLSLEIFLRIVLFEFMIRKGFKKTIPCIFVNILYSICCFVFTFPLFGNFPASLILLSISIVFHTVFIQTNERLWWQILMSLLLSYCFLSYDVQLSLTNVLSYFFSF